MLTTVIELDEFLRQAKGVMTDAERAELVDYLAANPDAGVALGVDCEKCALPGKARGKAAGSARSTSFGQRSAR